MAKCSSHGCTKKAVIFELPSKFETFTSDRVNHCLQHYNEGNQDSWGWEVDMGMSTWSEEEYLLDLLKVTL